MKSWRSAVCVLLLLTITTALKTTVQIKPGDSLLLELEVSDPVEVIYSSTGAAAGSSGQICTVDGGSLQCKPEYKHRTSLLSSVLELRDMKISDSGVYTMWNNRTEEAVHIYTVTVQDDQQHKGPVMQVWMVHLIFVGVVLAALVILCVAVNLTQDWMSKKRNKAGRNG